MQAHIKRATHGQNSPTRATSAPASPFMQDPVRKMGPKTTEQQVQVARCALFLIDNTPECPLGTNFRAHTNTAIVQHLARHTYTYQENRLAGDSNTREVTAHRVRTYVFRRLWDKSKIAHPKLPGEDCADALFRLRSTVVPDSVKSLYNYDPQTFSETDLPGFGGTHPPDLQDSAEGGAYQSGSDNVTSYSAVPATSEKFGPAGHLTSQSTPSSNFFGEASGHEKRKRGIEEAATAVGFGAGEVARAYEVPRSPKRRASVEGPYEPVQSSTDPADSDKQADTLAGGVKRTRETERTETIVGFGNEETTHTSGDFRSSKRRASAETPSTAGPPVSVPSPQIPLAVTPGPPAPVEHMIAATPEQLDTSHKTVTSESPHDVLNRKPEGQQETWQLNEAAISSLYKQSFHLQRDVEDAALGDLLPCIGRLNQACSPFVIDPSDALAALYARCLGTQWETICEDFSLFGAPQFTMSLISAFLYDHVMSQPASVQKAAREITKLFESMGYVGKAFLPGRDMPLWELEASKAARASAIEDARTTLAQDDASVKLQLQAEAKALTAKFWDIVAPHFRNLSAVARMYRRSSGRSEEDLREVFERIMPNIIEKALHQKLQVQAAGRDYTYTWPNHGDTYNGADMTMFGARERLPCKVRYIIFPGLNVKAPKKTWTIHSPAVRAYHVSVPSDAPTA